MSPPLQDDIDAFPYTVYSGRTVRPRENIWRNGHTVTMHGDKEETAAPHDTETGPGKVCAGLSGGGKCGKLLAQSVSGIRMREHMSHSVRRGGNRIGRIGNRVRFTDGAAAVSTDGQIMAKASHWGDPRRQIRSMNLSKGASQKNCCGEESFRTEYPGTSDIATENDGCSDDPMGSSLFFRRF